MVRRIDLSVYSREDANSNNEREYEIAYYGRLVDRSILDKAFAVEEQEQHAVFPPKKEGDTSTGQVRVRRTVELRPTKSKPRFEVTAKSPYGKDGGRAEANTEVDEVFFIVFKRTATTSMKKTRYSFRPQNLAEVYPKTNLLIQMDVFEGTDWVKIDVEGKMFMPEDKDYFPKGVLADVIPHTSSKRTRNQEMFVRELYDKHFK